MNLLDIIKGKQHKLRNELFQSEIEKNKAIKDYHDSMPPLNGKSLAGGVPNQTLNAGDVSEAWSFPQQFAITSKRMDNNAICSNVLNYYTSLIKSFSWKFEYKTGVNDDLHNKVKEMFEEQFEKAGGLEYFLGQAIREFMKYGFVLMSPNLSFKSKRITKTYELIPTIESIVFLDPQWVYAFYGDEQDGNKVNAVRYINQPKTIYKDGEVIDLPASSTIIDFDKSLSALCTLDGYGNPMGVSFLKDVWDLWRVLNNMNSSFNSNLVQFGEHSWNFVPNQAFFDNANSTSEVSQNINEFISNGGGVFMCQYGTLEKMDSMDLSKYDDYHTNISQELARRKGLSIDVLGESHGASRNLAQFAQSTAVTRASEIASQFAFQFSERFIKNYFENVFAKYYFTKQLTDTPSLVFELLEGTPDTVGQVEEVKTEEELDVFINDNAMIVQDGKKTWIKSKATDIESYVINTTTLDNVLISVEDRISDFILLEMKKHLLNKERIQKAVENPTSIINGKTLSSAEQKEFTRGLESILVPCVQSLFLEEADNYERLLVIQNKEFEKELKQSKIEFAYKQTQILLRNKVIKEFKKMVLANFINQLDNTLTNETKFLQNMHNVELSVFDDMIAKLTENLSNIKGRDFISGIKDSVMSLFGLTNKQAIKKTDNDGLTLIRSGVLESQCRHCAEWMGAEYDYINNEWYNSEYEYVDLPDPNCLGGSRCRCFYVRVPMEQIRAMEQLKNG